jgi:hypothetical protein
LAQMAMCIKHKLPSLSITPLHSGVMSLACYGPSLKDTWQDLKRPIMSMSGSHDFLIERGIIPDFHVDIDPRLHKLTYILKPHKDVQYLMASVCHPFTWSLLKGYNVKTWHVVSGKNTKDWIAKHDPGTILLAGGSSVGLCATHIGGVLGYQHFEIHGMDGSFSEDNKRHAGNHYGRMQYPIEWTANGHTYKTSRVMMNANVEMINMLKYFPFFAVFHGKGLMQDMIIDADLPNAAIAGTEKAEAVLTAEVKYIEQGVAF